MVQVFNSKTVKSMDDTIKEKIQQAGVPIECYLDGMYTLGPVNKSSVTKFAIINTNISKFDLPLPPSLYMETIVERCNNRHDKQDFREIIDGQKPGDGKSTGALSQCCRYAIEAAERGGQDCKDYFTLENAALLEDTERITYMLDGLDKYQAVLIDDAGVGIGNRDFQTQSNKNISAIMQTCRTKRWYVVFTAPIDDMMDIHIRKLTYAKSKIVKPCHEAGFNIVQHKGVIRSFSKGKSKEINPHFVYGNDKNIQMYAIFSPDMYDPYKGLMAKYDKIRESAANDLIHKLAVEEKERKNPVNKHEKKMKDNFDEYGQVIYNMTHAPDGQWLKPRSNNVRSDEGTYSVSKISAETGLNAYAVNKIIAHLKSEGR